MVLARRLQLLATVIACLVALPSPATAHAPERRASTVLVTLAEGASIDAVASAHGANIVGSFPSARTFALATTAAAGLADDSRVLSTEPDGKVRAQTAAWNTASWNTASWNGASWDTASSNGASWDTASWNRASWDGASWDRASWDESDEEAEPTDLAWGLVAIRAPDAWSRGIPDGTRTVCMVDSGVDASHSRLAGRIVAGRDFVRGDEVPEDEGGHGTHLAGIIAGLPGSDPFRGVGAPHIAAAKVLDGTGTGSTSNVIAGIAWCASIQANVILLALSEDAPTRALAQSIKGAQDAGILVVASAGNAGPCSRCLSYPAAYPGVLAVAAAKPDGTLAPFSSTDPRVSLAAPGVDIMSLFPGETYRLGSGTSQAAAFAAGAAALVWAQDAGLSAHQVQDLLEHASFRPGARAAGSGFGLLDVGAASEAIRRG